MGVVDTSNYKDTNNRYTGTGRHLTEDTVSAWSVSWLGFVAGSLSESALCIRDLRADVLLEHFLSDLHGQYIRWFLFHNLFTLRLAEQIPDLDF